MYIAGLNIPINLTHNQLVEGIATFSTVAAIVNLIRQQLASAAKANNEAGPIKTLPTSKFLRRIVTPVHGLAMTSTPLAYILGVTFNGLEQPGWMRAFNFSLEVDAAVGVCGKASLRIAACVGLYMCGRLVYWVSKHLGGQFHYIGRREKPRVVSTGPYAYVRHPGYATALTQQLLLAIIFWSYAPLVAFGISAAAFAVKMPIEEQLIQDDPETKLPYAQYKQRVPARVIPYIW